MYAAQTCDSGSPDRATIGGEHYVER